VEMKRDNSQDKIYRNKKSYRKQSLVWGSA